MTGRPDPATERTVLESDRGPVAALRSGDAGAPAVLLLPGYTGSKEDFAPLLPALATAGFAVTAIDLPGQFESPGPADPSAYTPGELAQVVRAIARNLAPQPHLVGHSFGGLVARAAVIADVDAFASLALMCSGPSGIGGERRQMIEFLEPVLAASGMAGVYAASMSLYRDQIGYVEPPAEVAAFLERRFLAGVPEMLQGMGQALRSEPDRVAELAGIAVPKLVLYGVDDDAWPPPAQDEMAKRLGADRVVIAHAAHSPAVENPAATAKALVAFWHRVQPPTAPR